MDLLCSSKSCRKLHRRKGGQKYIYIDSPIKLPQTSKAGKPKSKKLTARDRLGEFEYKWLNVQENERSEI